ncbi:unnamed protein product [Calypogeia fissa]
MRQDGSKLCRSNPATVQVIPHATRQDDDNQQRSTTWSFFTSTGWSRKFSGSELERREMFRRHQQQQDGYTTLHPFALPVCPNRLPGPASLEASDSSSGQAGRKEGAAQERRWWVAVPRKEKEVTGQERNTESQKGGDSIGGLAVWEGMSGLYCGDAMSQCQWQERRLALQGL